MTGEPRSTAVGPERDYRALVERLRAHVAAAVPARAVVLVVSRGDDALLRLPGCEAAHFPQSPTGLYAGFHPTDGAEAATHLADLRSRGAEYLVIPATAAWWLDHYPELVDELATGGGRVVDDPETCFVYALTEKPPEPAAVPTREEADARRTAPQAAALIRALLPDAAGVVLVGSSAEAVEVDDRPCWRAPAPGPQVTAGDVLERVEAACAAGARYVVLLHADAPAIELDGRLRRRIGAALRPVFRQRLVEAFEVARGDALAGA